MSKSLPCHRQTWKNYFLKVAETWHLWKVPYRLCTPTALAIPCQIGKMLKECREGALRVRLVWTELVVSRLVCLNQCALFGPPGTFMSFVMRLLHHDQRCYHRFPSERGRQLTAKDYFVCCTAVMPKLQKRWMPAHGDRRWSEPICSASVRFVRYWVRKDFSDPTVWVSWRKT